MNIDQANDEKEEREPSHRRDADENKKENPSKVEDLTKAGRENFDPNEGSD